jgi:hypothetical protein
LLFWRSASGDRPFITTTAVWLATIPTIFIPVFALSIFLAILTWRATPDRKGQWKAFWNVIEIVWLVGTGLSIFGIISTQAASLVPIIVSSYEQDAHHQGERLSDFARQTQQTFCSQNPVDEDICSYIFMLTDLRKNSAIINNDTLRFGSLVNQFKNKHPESPALPAISKLSSDYWDYVEATGFLIREPKTLIVPGWAKWVTIFAPQIFSFVFPLRLGRALAVFAL